MAVKLGDILYRAVSAWLRLPGNITTTRKVLAQTGDGVDSAAPEWTDEYADKDYVAEQIANANVGGAAQNSFLVSGGQVAWLVNYDFLVSAASYYIDGVLYASAESTITLNASDPTNDRIDVIAVDNTGTVVKITGTPAPNPSEPDIDPGTQLKLAFVFVAASSTQPTVTNEVLYYDNAGAPGEWNWTASGSGFVVNSTNNPKAPSTTDIEGTTVTAGAYAQGQIGSGTYDPNDANLLVLYIRSKATWANNRGLAITLRSTGVLIGSAVNINRTGSFGFDSSITGVYQLVAIPISLFAVTAGTVINQIRITAFGNGHGFYLDDIYFQEEGATQQPVGITQEQADARYLLKSLNLTDLTSTTTATAQLNDLVGDTGAGGIKGLAPAPAAGDAAAGKYLDADGTWTVPTGAGDVTGPASATDEAVALFNGTTGKVIKNSVIVVTTTGAITGPTSVAVGGSLVTNTKLTVEGQVNIKPSNHAAAGAAETLDFAVSNEHTVILDETCTFTLSNPVDGGRYVIILIQDASGGNNVVWPASVRWPAGTTPTITSGADKADLVTLFYISSLGIYLGSINQDYTTT